MNTSKLESIATLAFVAMILLGFQLFSSAVDRAPNPPLQAPISSENPGG